jgi:hypothetical protein
MRFSGYSRFGEGRPEMAADGELLTMALQRREKTEEKVEAAARGRKEGARVWRRD